MDLDSRRTLVHLRSIEIFSIFVTYNHHFSYFLPFPFISVCLSDEEDYTNLLKDPESDQIRPVNQKQAEELLKMSPNSAALQFPRLDAKLFCNLIPHQCLGGIWSRRQQLPERQISSVKATIDQFNRVVYAVIGTVLTPRLEPSNRAKVIQKWIEIAVELSKRKNLSSMKAIVSGLQSHAIHRLTKAWNKVDKVQKQRLIELGGWFNDSQTTTKLIEKHTNMITAEVSNMDFLWLTKKFSTSDPELLETLRMPSTMGPPPD